MEKKKKYLDYYKELIPTRKKTKEAIKSIKPAMPKIKKIAKDFAVDAALTLTPVGKILKPVYKGVKSVSKIMKRGK